MGDEVRLDSIRTPKAIIRFAVPTMVVMVFISTYSIVDGALVSNMICTDALAGLNIAMPVCSLFTAFGFMFATGGSAYAAKKLGEGDVGEARRSFSGLSVVAAALSVITTAFILLFSSELVDLMGADDRLHGYSEEYLTYFVLFSPVMVLQFMSMQFLIVAGRPGLSLAGSIVGGISNIVLDVVFMGPLDMGIKGAAIASGIGSAVPFAVGAAYFVFKKDSPIRYARPSFRSRMIAKVCSNGASEMVTEMSGSVTTLLFNLTMMAYIGPDGVSAITILMYVQFLALAVILGYSMGVAPLMSYNYGADRKTVMNMLFKTSVRFTMMVSIVVFVVMELFGGFVIGLFTGGSEHVKDIAATGARIYAVAFLYMMINDYASSLFTSLSNGLLSAVISFVGGLCLLAPTIILVPMVFGPDGIWYAVPITEAVTLILSVSLIVKMGPRYGYLGSGTCRKQWLYPHGRRRTQHNLFIIYWINPLFYGYRTKHEVNQAFEQILFRSPFPTLS